MRHTDPENIISGSCQLFVCRFCQTKYGREHQKWCDSASLTQPRCRDCKYFAEKNGSCAHPAKKNVRREDMPREEDQRPLYPGKNARQH